MNTPVRSGVLPPDDRLIAYFSMEIGFDPTIPTYSGGLGVLAGDTLRAAADLKLPIVGITLLAKEGYFTQAIDPHDGHQIESPTVWKPVEHLTLMPAKVSITIERRDVFVQAWVYEMVGVTGFHVPILFLDTDLPENAAQDRGITNRLYGGDQRYRLLQEAVLGIGGVRLLQALGYHSVNRFHMNEGHAALLAVELFKEHTRLANQSLADPNAYAQSIDAVRKLCVFTTHTPVAAGHDKFPWNLVTDTIGEFIPLELFKTFGGQDSLNMTLLALNLSHYVNSVAKKHMDVSNHLFPGYHFSFITNGVHSVAWTCEPLAELFDQYMPGWRYDSFELRHALNIPKHEIWNAHLVAKRALIEYVNTTQHVDFDPEVFTLGFARRATAYKRADLLFHDIARLKQLAGKQRLQIIFAGKAHPNDTQGKELIQKIRWHIGEVADAIKVVYLPDYDIALAKKLIPGVDVWLNTPARPREASGTSGMKAAHNGVPSLSVLDGWWIEGHNEGVTGWSIGPHPTEENENTNDDASDAAEIYDKLEHIILPTFYEQPDSWQRIMRHSIAFNASFFNTHRMVQQYALKAYLR
jgi:starch phosphorylase